MLVVNKMRKQTRFWEFCKLTKDLGDQLLNQLCFCYKSKNKINDVSNKEKKGSGEKASNFSALRCFVIYSFCWTSFISCFES